jgi:hypothetical protein
MKYQNLGMELLKKILNPEINTRRKTKQGKSRA